MSEATMSGATVSGATAEADAEMAALPAFPPFDDDGAPRHPEVARRESELWAGRVLGAALALAAADPAGLAHAGYLLVSSVVRLALVVVMGLIAWFAAPPVVARPVSGDPRWASKLSRHRNTVLAVGFVVVVAIGSPPTWMMFCDAALLLAYLLFVDAAAGGPPGAAQLRDWPLLLAAIAAQGLVLVGAVVSVATAGAWARATAAALVLAVGVGVALSVRRRRA
ncbi:hypothetical protein [Streptacidiphilus anmyonensis]|uniref:hypothetical protein n=1 Tax=Streptacidiphilus anmyonensis TaxID=405782 RepID=UPI000694574F|nr:hypothetical protein [Streptacidiphilus anmyonensis]